MVAALGDSAYCVAIIAIGQCATFGGYPGCRPPLSPDDAGFDTAQAQSGAMGVHDYLTASTGSPAATHLVAAGKVINTPGCPTNPWWFVLTVVALTVDLKGILIDGNAEGPLKILKAHLTTPGHPALGDNPIVEPSTGVDGTRRIAAVYGTSVHGPYCPRYQYFVKGKFAANPGDRGCLQKLGCKGPAASSLCGIHGWNGQQPTNPVAWDHGVSNANLSPGGVPTGGHCTRAGHPCMA